MSKDISSYSSEVLIHTFAGFSYLVEVKWDVAELGDEAEYWLRMAGNVSFEMNMQGKRWHYASPSEYSGAGPGMRSCVEGQITGTSDPFQGLHSVNLCGFFIIHDSFLTLFDLAPNMRRTT